MQKNKGLSKKKASEKIKKFGLNKVEEKRLNPFKKFLKWLYSPVTIMLLIAALLSFYAGKTFDFYFILVLMILNFSIGFWQEKKADNAIKKLNQKLSINIRVLRDGIWQNIKSELLVPGDIIELNPGDIIPGDLKILEEKGLNVNESALTGESLPKHKGVDEICYSGSFVAFGWVRGKIIATGKKTYFGKILISIDKSVKRSALEEDIVNISKTLAFFSILAVLILTFVFLLRGHPFSSLLMFDLSLIIAGIPISLPTVMTLIISFGVLKLADKETVVRRLSALEDLANVNLLLSDKTGTLTKNEISVEKVISYGKFSEEEVLTAASFTTHANDKNPINIAIRKKIAEQKITTEHKIILLIPFDSERKRSTAKIVFKGEKILIRAGADQIIKAFCNLDKSVLKKFESDIVTSAKNGYRTIAVAGKKYSEGKKKMTLYGILLFSDTIEEGVNETLKFIRNNGIKVKMLTGDNIFIAKRIANELNIRGKTVNKKGLKKDFKDLTKKEFKEIGTFAEILPIDKYHLVSFAQSSNHNVVAVTGDGINDLPALKTANVSIAVKNAVDVLKSVADINLTIEGISVIKDAIVESRKIFSRLYTYSIYRISESFRVIASITLLGIFYGFYPLTPIQLILLALLNDIPIISLAFNRVKITTAPSKIKARARLKLSSLFGLVGIINSLMFFIIAKNYLQLDGDFIRTLFFLKLTISGHMLIYVAHTMKRWYKYLPSKSVILSTLITQIVATIIAWEGIFMNPVSLQLILFVWIWGIFWMQISELMKIVYKKIQN